MNFLKKKLKPFTAGLSSANNSSNNNQKQRDLEDDLYDEYVVEAPPHPSELLALGVEPSEIDVNDPDKLRELYRKAKEEGKDKKVNSVLLAKQRQREEIEERKKSREEWKFFDSLTSRVEQVVKDTQKNLDQLRESSAIDKLDEPEYELRLTPEEAIKYKPRPIVKEKVGESSQLESAIKRLTQEVAQPPATSKGSGQEELDEFGCPKRKLSVTLPESKPQVEVPSQVVVEELLEDLGLDLRTAEQKKALQEKRRLLEIEQKRARQQEIADSANKNQEIVSKKLDIDIKAAVRPRPRPGQANSEAYDPGKKDEADIDPFDTSFVSPVCADENLLQKSPEEEKKKPEAPKIVDPFDTSYVDL